MLKFFKRKLSALAFIAVCLAVLSGCVAPSEERRKFCELPGATCEATCRLSSRNQEMCKQRCWQRQNECERTGCFYFDTLGPQCETFSPNHSR